MHPDHSNGLTDANGKAIYPHVELVVAERDVDALVSTMPRWRARPSGSRCASSSWAREQIAPYQNQRREPKGEVFPGVTAVPLYGHTPGHTGYLVASKGEQLLIWGDIVHMPDIQTRRPDVYMEPDVDGQAAIATRKRIMDMVATDRLLAAGMHMHFPGFLNLNRRAGRRLRAGAGNMESGVLTSACPSDRIVRIGRFSGPRMRRWSPSWSVVVAFTTGPWTAHAVPAGEAAHRNHHHEHHRSHECDSRDLHVGVAVGVDQRVIVLHGASPSMRQGIAQSCFRRCCDCFVCIAGG